MSVMPFMVYGLLKGDWVQMIKRVIVSGGLNLVMCMITLFLLFTQYKVATDSSISEGKEYVMKKFFTRTTGEKKHNGNVIKNPQLLRSKDAPYAEVLSMALNYPGLSFGGAKKPLIQLKYKWLILLVLISGVSGYLIQSKKQSKRNSDIRAILIATLIASVAPLSWLIIFKPHSYLHMHIVIFTWYLPFLVLGGGLVGLFISSVISHRRGTLA